MPKSYYRILGVDSDATPDEIRSAYRRRVKKLHPDRHGEDSAPFLALQEAYETLIDPKLREVYDSMLASKVGRSPAQRQRRSESYRRRRPPVEPLDSYGVSSPVEDLTWSRSSIPLGYHSGDDPLSDRVNAIFHHQPRNLFVEIPITPHQARQGGQIQVVIPSEEICSSCRGEGSIDFYSCPNCRGMGRISKQLPIRVDFSGGVTNLARGEISLNRYGLPGVNLIIRFRVI